MAWDDPYMSAEEFRARVGSVGAVTGDALTAVLVAASRQIDNETGRNFNKSAVPEARYVTARFADAIDVPDLLSVDELAVDDGSRTYATVWAATDFDLAPVDAADRGHPYAEIRVAPLGARRFAGTARGVRITGIWGWPAVPAPIAEATFLIANRQKSLWTAPFGVSGGPANGQFGSIRMAASDLDPTIAALLAPYRVTAV